MHKFHCLFLVLSHCGAKCILYGSSKIYLNTLGLFHHLVPSQNFKIITLVNSFFFPPPLRCYILTFWVDSQIPEVICIYSARTLKFGY